MIEINLLPAELRKKEVTRFAMPNILNRQFIMGLAALFVAVHALLGGLAVYQTAQLGYLKSQIASLKEATKETTKQKSELKASRELMGQIEQMTQRKFSWARLLNSLSGSVPKGLWLRSFLIQEERVVKTAAKATPKPAAKPPQSKGSAAFAPKDERVVTLKLEGSVVGNGQETATISRFIKTLKDEPYFSALFDEVEFFKITQRKIKSFDVYDFTIHCVFKKGKF